MRLHALALALACGAVASPSSAQTAAANDVILRIRFVGPEVFEIPGVLRIDRGNVVAAGDVTVDDTFVRVARPGPSQPLTVVRWRKRIVGEAVGVENGVLMMRVNTAVIYVPLDSIGTVDVSDERVHRHLLRGVLVGVGTFWGVGVLMINTCGFGCGNLAILPAVAGGIAAGVLAGRGRERWTPHPTVWLASQFAARTNP